MIRADVEMAHNGRKRKEFEQKEAKRDQKLALNVDHSLFRL
jgi:hypothetical protein